MIRKLKRTHKLESILLLEEPNSHQVKIIVNRIKDRSVKILTTWKVIYKCNTSVLLKLAQHLTIIEVQ